MKNNDRLKIFKCEIKKLAKKVEKESVDIILTDPPYPKEFLYCYRDLAEFAVHALKPGGHLLAMSGMAWLPEVFENMRVDGLVYQWTHAIAPLAPNGQCRGRSICATRWKPFIWYLKPPRDLRLQICDYLSMGKRDKKHHHWGQDESIFDHLLDKLKIKEGGLVCDPFLGGGTTAVSAVKKGFQFIGCDIDSKAIKETRQRLKAVQQDLI